MNTSEAISWETLIKLILAAMVIILFVYLGFKLFNNTRPDTDFASTNSFLRVFVGNTNQVYKTGIAKITFLNLGERRKVMFYDLGHPSLPGCDENERCFCLYNLYDEKDDEIIKCSRISFNINMKVSTDFNRFEDSKCFASDMGECEGFPLDFKKSTYHLEIYKDGESVLMMFS
jgi:hypothetical protein